MIHRITAIFDKDKVFEKIINLNYLLSVEPHAEKNKCFICFVTTTEKFSFIYNNMEDMKTDYEKIHTTLSDQFNSIHTVVDNCIDIQTEKTLLG
jgi:hypothetical protein